jgi:hypothetical protein
MIGNKTKLSALFLVFVCTGVFAQSENEPTDLITDRPDQTESSISVPHKSFQIETGFSYALNEQPLIAEKSTTLGSTLLRYGILKGAELRLGMDYSSMMTYIPDSPLPAVLQHGVSPIMLGAKINITEQEGWIPEMALLAHIQSSIFSSDYSTDYAVPQMILAASHTISSRFSLGYNFGIEWADNDAAPTKLYALVAGIGVTENIGLFVETFGSFDNGDFMSMIDGGFTFLILPNLQYDISGGVGVIPSSPDFFISTGISYRLPQ